MNDALLARLALLAPAGCRLALRPLNPADVDLLAVDWFALADRPVEEVRDLFGVVDRSAAARAAGSVGPWEPGGISEHQSRTARARAEAAGVAHETYGATP